MSTGDQLRSSVAAVVGEKTERSTDVHENLFSYLCCTGSANVGALGSNDRRIMWNLCISVTLVISIDSIDFRADNGNRMYADIREPQDFDINSVLVKVNPQLHYVCRTTF